MSPWRTQKRYEDNTTINLKQTDSEKLVQDLVLVMSETLVLEQ